MIGIPQVGNQPYYNHSYPEMASSVWKPTFLIQPGSFWDQLLIPQPMFSSSQILTHPLIPQQVQIKVSKPLQIVIASQPILLVFGNPQGQLIQPLKGTLQSQPLGKGTSQILIGHNVYSMAQSQLNPPYASMMQNPIGKKHRSYQCVTQVPFQGQHIQSQPLQPL